MRFNQWQNQSDLTHFVFFLQLCVILNKMKINYRNIIKIALKCLKVKQDDVAE